MRTIPDDRWVFTDFVRDILRVKRSCLCRFRKYVPKKYPELALIENEDYKKFAHNLIGYKKSAIEKMKKRQKLQLPNKKRSKHSYKNKAKRR